MAKVYVIGSLRNPLVPAFGEEVRALGYDVFDDWHSAGKLADDEWRRYEKERGHTYAEALQGYAARHVFAFDKKHLEEAQIVILLLPAGKSGHLEFGWSLGQGKIGFILLDQDYERFDVMYQFATGIYDDKAKMFAELTRLLKTTLRPSKSRKLPEPKIVVAHPSAAEKKKKQLRKKSR